MRRHAIESSPPSFESVIVGVLHVINLEGDTGARRPIDSVVGDAPFQSGGNPYLAAVGMSRPLRKCRTGSSPSVDRAV